MLWLFWRFVAPGLYQGERRWVAPIGMTSIGMFYLGVVFAYFVVFPLVLSFLISFVPPQVVLMPDISQYLSFVLYMTLMFGVLFQTPLLIVVLVRSGLLSTEALRQKRRYVIVLAFVLGMFLTPPDVVSQVLLALPLWLLFEIGVFCSSWVDQTKEQDVTHSHGDFREE